MQLHRETVLLRRSDDSTYTKAGVTVTVYVTDSTTTLATVYSDSAGATVVSGSALTTDLNGEVTFYAADGVYDLKITGTGLSTRWVTKVQVLEETPYVYDVTSYGAKGDGTTDDTVAILAAITAADAADGGEVLFPRGPYLFSSSIMLPSGVKLTGTRPTRDGGSSYSSTLHYSGGDYAIRCEDNAAGKFRHFPIMSDLRLEYKGSTASTHGVSVDRAIVNLNNIDIIGFTGNGLDVNTSIYSTFMNVKSEYNTGSGIKIHSTDETFPAGQMTLINCTSQFNDDHALELVNILALNVIGGTFALSTNEQVTMEGCINVSMVGAHLEPRLGDNRTYFDYLAKVVSATVNSVLIKSKNINIENCTFYAGQTGSTAQIDTGLLLADGTNNVRLTMNSFIGFDVYGIEVVYSGVEYGVVAGYDIGHNYFYDVSSTDVQTSGASATGRRWDSGADTWVYTGEYLRTPVVVFSQMTTTQRDALTPVTGMEIYNSTLSKKQVYTGAAWETITSA